MKCRFCHVEIVWNEGSYGFAGVFQEMDGGGEHCLNSPTEKHEAPSQLPAQLRDHKVGCLLCNTPTWNTDSLCERHTMSVLAEVPAHSHTRSRPETYPFRTDGSRGSTRASTRGSLAAGFAHK